MTLLFACVGVADIAKAPVEVDTGRTLDTASDTAALEDTAADTDESGDSTDASSDPCTGAGFTGWVAGVQVAEPTDVELYGCGWISSALCDDASSEFFGFTLDAQLLGMDEPVHLHIEPQATGVGLCSFTVVPVAPDTSIPTSWPLQVYILLD